MTKKHCTTTEEFHYDRKKINEFFLKHLGATIKLPIEYFDADSVAACIYPSQHSLHVAKIGLEMSIRDGGETLDIISARSKITIKKDRKIIFSCPATVCTIVIFPIDQVDKAKSYKLVEFVRTLGEVGLLSYRQNEEFIIWSCSNIEEYEKQLVKSGVELPNMRRLPLLLIGSEPVQDSEIYKWLQCEPVWTIVVKK